MTLITPTELGGLIPVTTDPAAVIGLATRQAMRYQGHPGVTSDVLHDLALYLAAHLVAIQDPLLQSVSDGDTSVTYHRGTLGEGLLATLWGQQAHTLAKSVGLDLMAKPMRWRID